VEFVASGGSSSAEFSTLYDYQQKYISSLVRQLPPGAAFSGISRQVSIHPPQTIKALLARQGPFLLQPSPIVLENSEGGDATDIAYLDFGHKSDSQGDRAETEHLGVVAIAYRDGKVDLCLDVEKVEARWSTKQV
jgi:nucleoporin NUP82